MKKYYILARLDGWNQVGRTGPFLTLDDAKANSCRDERVLLCSESPTERHQIEVYRNVLTGIEFEDGK